MTPGRIILGENASQEAVDQKNEELGYYDPFFVQFFNYLKDAITKLDFGESYRTSKPVFDDVFARIPNSLKISFNGILGACIIGIPLGILSAVKQYSAVDTISRVTAMLAAAIPPFWLGMMLIFAFALKLGLAALVGRRKLETLYPAHDYAGHSLRRQHAAHDPLDHA